MKSRRGANLQDRQVARVGHHGPLFPDHLRGEVVDLDNLEQFLDWRVGETGDMLLVQ